MEKVAVITGVTGQDGALLSKFLLELGYKIVGVDRRTSSATDWRLKELGLYDDPKFQLASGDLIDAGSITRIVQEHRPDEFYNLGAMSFVAESWKTPAATHHINAVGPINCLEAIRNHKPDCRFYQASSSEMFGGAHRVETLDEESVWHPRSPYGVSKLSAHWSTINYRESFDLFACCGILFNHESEFRGLEFVTRKITDGLVRIKLGLQDTVALGNLDSCRDWGYAGDYIRGMWMMLQQDKPEEFVLATGQAFSIRQFVEAALSTLGLEGAVDRYITKDPRFYRPADVGYLLGNAAKARTLLHWNNEVAFEEMVRRMVARDMERVSNAIR